MQAFFKECERFDEFFPFRNSKIDHINDLVEKVKTEYITLKYIRQTFKFSADWEAVRNEVSPIARLLSLPELYFEGQSGTIDKLTFLCLCLLWCKETEFNSSSKDNIFKDLSKTNSIKYILEKLVRISTILVYGRLKDFGFNANTFLIDHEFEILNQKIKDLVEIVY